MKSLEKFKLNKPEVIKGGNGPGNWTGGGNDGDRWGNVDSEQANDNG